MQYRVLLLVFVFYGIAVSKAQAGESFEMRVTASVLGVCKIAGTQDIHFGGLDPSQAVNSTAQGSVTFKCTRGVDYHVSADHGQNYDVATQRRRMKGGDAWYLPYSLSTETFAGVGLGFNQSIVLNIDATILGNDYRDLPALQYSDVLRLTLEP